MIKQLKEVAAYRRMLVMTVKKDLRARYRGSFLGFLWTFVNPLAQLIVYSIVFPYLLKSSQENYPMFIFVGLLPWIFFTSTVTGGTTSVTANANLVKKIYFPRLILPLSTASTNLMNFLFGLCIVLPALLITGIKVGACVLFLPLVILSQYIFSAAIGTIFAALYVYLRDLEHIVGILMLVWFYLTPVVFGMEIFPEEVASKLMYNPMTQYVMAYRNVLMYNKPPDALGFILVSAGAVVLFILSVMLFSRLQIAFAEEL